MTMTNTEAAKLAKTYVGSGPSTFYSYYSKHATPKISSGPWCACFASSILMMAGATAPGFPGLYCPTMCKEAKKAGATVPVSQAQPGDVVFFNWDRNDNADHVGICQGVDVKSKLITTVDGNVSNRVGRRTRTFGEVMAVVRPKYATKIIERAKLLIDGVFGKITVKALQESLASKGYYDGLVDGMFGPMTATALQRYLAKLGYYTRAVDGNFGYYSVVALQNWLRHLGYYTTAYLIDGKWGAFTTKALQKALNANRF